MNHEVLIKQMPKGGGIHIELNNLLGQGQVPRKNYYYTIISNIVRNEDLIEFDRVNYWLNPFDQCTIEHFYPPPRKGIRSPEVYSFTVLLNEYDI